MTEPRKTLLIVVCPADNDATQRAVIDAAKQLAPIVDDGQSPFEVSVIEGFEGTPYDYFSGDNIESFGWNPGDPR